MSFDSPLTLLDAVNKLSMELHQQREIERFVAFFQEEEIDHQELFKELLGHDIFFLELFSQSYLAKVGNREYLCFMWTDLMQGLSSESEQFREHILLHQELMHLYFTGEHI